MRYTEKKKGNKAITIFQRIYANELCVKGYMTSLWTMAW